jgi:D-glycero-beta-D-manno-heptose-7-phosphate kinase
MDKDTYHTIIDQFDHKSIMVIGDIMLDWFILGTVSRISPEAPVPLVEVNEELFQLGGVTNAVNNIRVLVLRQ